MEGYILEIFFITSITPNQVLGHKFIRLPTEELQLVPGGALSIPNTKLERIRVVTTMNQSKKVRTYNPTEIPTEDETAWMYGNCILRNLPWDPAEWKWKRQGMIQQCDFFSYTTKLGYKIGLSKIPGEIQALQPLQLYGFTKKQTGQLLNIIWHPWTPGKINSMNWLTIVGGLPIGEWRRKAGWEGHCRLCQNCTQCTLETAEHGLMRCDKVKEAWTYTIQEVEVISRTHG